MMKPTRIYAEESPVHHDVAPLRPPATRDRSWLRWDLPLMVRQVVFLMAGFPFDILVFTVCLSLFCTGLGLTLVWAGLPLLVVTLQLASGAAEAGRRMLRAASEVAIPAPHYRRAKEGASYTRRFLGPLLDPQRWLDLLWTQVNAVVSIATFAVVCTWVAGSCGVVAGPIVDLIFRGDEDYHGLADLMHMHQWWARSVADIAVGMLFLLTLPAALRAMTLLRVAVNTVLLGLRPSYERRLTELQQARDAGRQAESRSLRRLEQDIHDGPQQRLIRLQMDLSRAQRAASTDPDRATQALGQARETTADILAELRNLSRGIAPPVLVDRGLDAALVELAALSEVPVTVSGWTDRLPHHVASTAYFMAAESLTNVNKHSGADRCEILVDQGLDRLTVVVSDTGHGGASMAKGHGLAGLAERLRSVEGILTVHSPAGGPTRITGSIPIPPLGGTQAPCDS